MDLILSNEYVSKIETNSFVSSELVIEPNTLSTFSCSLLISDKKTLNYEQLPSPVSNALSSGFMPFRSINNSGSFQQYT